MCIIPSWYASVYVSHRVHIEAGVFDEIGPLICMRLRRCAPYLPVPRARLGKQLYQLFTRLVFSFIDGHAEDVAERAKRGRQAVRQRQNHRVFDLLQRHVHAAVAQHGAVEGAVVDDDGVGCISQRLQALAPIRVPLRAVPHVGGLLVYCDRHKQHLGLFGVAVRAVLDRHGAVGFKVKPEGRHPRCPCKISLTRP